MIDRYQELYPGLTFAEAADGVLQITMEGSGLNSVSAAMHRELADVWITIDRDPAVRVALIARVERVGGRRVERLPLRVPHAEFLGIADQLDAIVRVGQEARVGQIAQPRELGLEVHLRAVHDKRLDEPVVGNRDQVLAFELADHL